ncbi:MAG: major capsid protein V20 domain-containing protein, partial [Candidatus Fonsibacter sp.]
MNVEDVLRSFTNTPEFMTMMTSSYSLPGSLGSFNLQLQVTVENNQNFKWAGNEYELVIMVMDSGV